MARIEPFIHQKVVVLHQDDTAGQAARAMRERHIGCVIVADHEGHIVGIVTDRDLALNLLADSGDPDTPLSDFMTREVVSVDEYADIENVLRVMELRGIRRVPVIREEGEHQRCVGIVTLDDLIASKSADYYHLMRIVRSQVLRRVKAPGRLKVIEPVPQAGAAESAEPFYQRVFERISPKARLTPRQAEKFSKIVFEALVRRLHHTGAMHLISQLPKPLQLELMEIPPGPDVTVNVHRMVAEIGERFGWDESTTYLALTRFCTVLDETTETRELEQVKAQLPKDFRALFAQKPSSQARKMEIAS